MSTMSGLMFTHRCAKMVREEGHDQYISLLLPPR